MVLPLSWLYGSFTAMRNYFFDKGLTRSFKFDFPVITVGNLSTGGTGKTPHIEFIIRLLKGTYTTGVVSRGYGRRTKGFLMVDENSEALKVGDEPLQIKQNHPETNVAVGEERILAIPSLLHEAPDTQVILLDDAYQHRYVKAGVNILLSDYNKPFYTDFVLPAGNLREFRYGYKRADVIVVTKCTADLSSNQKQEIIKQISPTKTQKVLFSHFKYGTPYSFTSPQNKFQQGETTQVLFFAGIANAQPLEQYLKENFEANTILKLPDHVPYNTYRLGEIKKQFEAMPGQNKILLTTQKDAVKLALPALQQEITNWPLYVLPVEVDMEENEKQEFKTLIETYIAKELSYNKEEN